MTSAPPSAVARSLMNRQMANYRKTVNLNANNNANLNSPEQSNQNEQQQQQQSSSTTSSSSPVPSKRRSKGNALSSSSGSSSKRPKPEPTLTGPRLKEIGGLKEQILLLLELVALPILHPEVYIQTGVKAPRGVLLCGPPGTGKTMLANAIAGELGVPFITISAPSVVSGMSGESERALRERFEDAAKSAPCILFIDEIDAITPKRETAQREMERRIVAQLLTCLDDLDWEKSGNKPVLVLGATNRPDSLDPALRRAGRFDREIELGIPDEEGREQILRTLTSELQMPPDFNFKLLARSTPGYVGADLSALVSSAGIIAVKRIFSDLALNKTSTTTASLSPLTISNEPTDENASTSMIVDGDNNNEQQQQQQQDNNKEENTPEGSVTPSTESPQNNSNSINNSNNTEIIEPPAIPPILSDLPLSIASQPIPTFLREYPDSLPTSILSTLSLVHADFQQALTQVQPSSQREGFTTVPSTTWADIGALDNVRDELRMAIVEPIRNPEIFSGLGIESPCGVLLWGPPGCGKTLLARAVANESGANFIGVKGPELLNKYVGESERAVRQVFQRARASSPCVIFFDELDALVPKRDDNLSEASARVVNTLLTELDGLEPLRQVYVLGATNRPDIVDPAMTRPGRLDKLLYIDLPLASERLEILRALSRKTRLDASVDLQALANDPALDGFSGADLNALVREAAITALRETLRLKYNNNTSKSSASSDSQDGSSMVDDPRPIVKFGHFQDAMKKVSPSVSASQRKRYSILHAKFNGQPLGKTAADDAEKATPVNS